MLVNIYSMKDLNAEYYLQPFVMRNDNEAIRAFQVATEDPNSFISKFPSQFDLVRLATFDDSTGEIMMDNKWLCNGINFARKDEDGE